MKEIRSFRQNQFTGKVFRQKHRRLYTFSGINACQKLLETTSIKLAGNKVASVDICQDHFDHDSIFGNKDGAILTVVDINPDKSVCQNT